MHVWKDFVLDSEEGGTDQCCGCQDKVYDRRYGVAELPSHKNSLLGQQSIIDDHSGRAEPRDEFQKTCGRYLIRTCHVGDTNIARVLCLKFKTLYRMQMLFVLGYVPVVVVGELTLHVVAHRTQLNQLHLSVALLDYLNRFCHVLL